MNEHTHGAGSGRDEKIVAAAVTHRERAWTTDRVEAEVKAADGQQRRQVGRQTAGAVRRVRRSGRIRTVREGRKWRRRQHHPGAQQILYNEEIIQIAES